MQLQKGRSNTIQFRVFNPSNGAGYTGITTWGSNCLISVDGGNWAVCTNTPVEVDATNAPGIYRLTLTSTECSYSFVAVCIFGYTGITYNVTNIAPNLWQGYTAPDWQTNVLGASHSSTTDTLERIRNAMDVALNPIVRST